MKGDGPVEFQRIVIRNKEGQMRFMVKDIGTHECLFLVHYIRGIAQKQIELLISISGVGGQTARTILSAYSPVELANIISNEQANMLKSVKGIGPKAAQRIIVELKDKISIDMTAGGQQTTVNSQQPIDNEVVKEAVAALTMLGFSPAPTQKVVLQLVKETPSLTVEQIIKQALKML